MARISQMDGSLIRGLVLGLLLVVDVHGSFSIECSALGPIAHDTDCSKYYACVGGKKVENVCPVMDDDGNRLHFNPRLHICDWPANAGCQLNTGCIGSCPSKNSPGNQVLLRNEDCTKFCKCNNGRSNVFLCPVGFHFNPTESACGDPKEAKCTGIGGTGYRR